ncbi:MAG: L-erythro-3,5-diaminohexanoate dehydrogenase [Candidatus Eremiobacteraeota bacterium]|nr:L-erythro-3,5-diaminohexanoate dehydrogenase [Candidatus Eremiobacteraeota bacterium]
MQPQLCRFGTHRVIEPPGTLPQAAWKLDATPVAFENEIRCHVDALNIDSASFRQIAEVCAFDPRQIAEHILATVRERGKQHNAVTGSGGMFVGRIAEIGRDLAGDVNVRVGDPVASLVSLSLTPLSLDAIHHIDVATGRVWVTGSAILFASGVYAKLPDDIPTDVALAVLDVAGAPAQVRRLAQPGNTVVVLGAAGKSGVLACAVARERTGASGRVIGIVPHRSAAGVELLLRQRYVDDIAEVDARDALRVVETLAELAPELADLTVNCVNVPGTELASILSTRDGGTVYFFSMSTSFTAAALGAEGVGKDVTMIVGNGYANGHADIALQTLRDHPPLMRYFEEHFGATPHGASRHD